MMKSIKVIFYLSIINSSLSCAGGLSKKQKKYEKTILKGFFQHEAAQDIFLEIIEEQAQTPLIRKIFQAFKASFSNPHTQHTLVQVLTLLNTYLVYPFFDKGEEYGDNFEIANIANNPEKIFINAVSSVLFSKFITAYYVKHKKAIENSEQALCKKNKAHNTLYTYLTCDAQDRKKGEIFSDVLHIISDSIKKQDGEIQKQTYNTLKQIASQKTSFSTDDLATIRLLLTQILSTV